MEFLYPPSPIRWLQLNLLPRFSLRHWGVTANGLPMGGHGASKVVGVPLGEKAAYFFLSLLPYIYIITRILEFFKLFLR